MDQHEEGVGRITRRTSVNTNVVADKGEDNRMEDMVMLSPTQSGRREPVPSEYQVRVVHCRLHALIQLFSTAILVSSKGLEN